MSVGGVRVAFHFNAVDPLGYTCRLIQKALGKGARLVVCAPHSVLQQLDEKLWAWSEAAFVPHASPEAPEHVLRLSPVWLRERLQGDEPGQVLVNLSHTTPAGFERFQRLIDVVSSLDADRAKARQRWREHTGQGRVPESFDVGGVAP